MLAKRIVNWLAGIVWLGAFCAFIFSGLCAPYDNSRFQFESVLVFMASMLLAASITALRRVIIRLADDNWRFTVLRVLALLVIVPLVCLALLYLVTGLSMVWEGIEATREYYELYPDRAP